MNIDYVELRNRINAGLKMGNAQPYVLDNMLRYVRRIEEFLDMPNRSVVMRYQSELHGFIVALNFCHKIDSDLYDYLVTNFYYI